MKKTFQEIATEGIEIYNQMEKDSGDVLASFRLCESMGVPAYKGVLTKLSQNMGFILSLAKSDSPSQNAETLATMLTGLTVDSILARMLLEEDHGSASCQADPGKIKRARTQRRRRKIPAQPQEAAAGETSIESG